MNTAEITYVGELRTSATHVYSGNSIITDAPLDNNGKAQAFSPTDLVATALASCMMTIMGIRARDMEVNIEGTKAEVVKIMSKEGPRKIDQIKVDIFMPANNYSVKDKKVLEAAGRTCPVAITLGENVIQSIQFHW